MAQVNERLGTEKISRLMIQMAIPCIVAQVINILYNIVDRIYIGHIPGVGSAALTGVGLTFPIIVLISAFSNIVGAGGAPLAAIWMGKGDKEHAEKIMGTGVALLLTFSACLMVFFYVFKVSLLYLFGASDATIGYSNSYMSIYLAGTVFVQLYLGLNPYIISQGFSKTAMISVLFGAIANLILDPVFIFAFDLGVQGAAIATVISQMLSAIWVLRFLTGRKAILRITWKNIRYRGAVIKNIVSLGIAPFVMTATESFVSIVLNHGLQLYGGDLYVGSMTILQSVLQAFTSPINGFTQGVQPIISYNFGAGLFDRVRMTYRRMIAISFAFLFCTSLFAVLCPELLGSLFTTDPELIKLVGKVLPIFIFGMMFFGLQTGIQPTFVGLGQAKIALFIACLRKLILLIPLAIILPKFVGVMGIYYAEPVSDIASATTATILFLINIRKILSKESLDKIQKDG